MAGKIVAVLWSAFLNLILILFGCALGAVMLGKEWVAEESMVYLSGGILLLTGMISGLVLKIRGATKGEEILCSLASRFVAWLLLLSISALFLDGPGDGIWVTLLLLSAGVSVSFFGRNRKKQGKMQLKKIGRL